MVSKDKRSLDEALAENVRAVLSTLDLTTGGLAERVGVSQKTISNIINCNHSAKISTLEKIATYLKQAPSELLTVGVSGGTSVAASVAQTSLLTSWEDASSQIGEFELEVVELKMVGAHHADHSYKPGTILLFQPVKEIHPGALYLFKIDGKKLPVFGQYHEAEEGFKIHFFNEANADIPVNESKPGSVIAALKESRIRYSLS